MRWFVLLFIVGDIVHGQSYSEAIMDNSFLIEEAYNQEPHVVQHISTWQYDRKSKDWEFGFTQEWPLMSLTHQISFGVPILRTGSSSGLGDIAVNYRYQAVMDPNGLSVSPRVSILLPTGDADKNLGSDPTYVQFNLPVSYRASERLAVHFNTGMTLQPGARIPTGKKTLVSPHVGASAIWLASGTFNVMMEWVSEWNDDGTGHDDVHVISPGARVAKNFGELQIVPGIAFPIQLNRPRGANQVFAYLSLEHPF